MEYGGTTWKLGRPLGVYCSKQAADDAALHYGGSREMRAHSGKIERVIG